MNSKKKIKYLVSLITVIIILGTLTELLLLNHFEDNQQRIPVVLLIAAFLIYLASFIFQKKLIKAFQVVMILCVISGILGCWFHLEANIEFESEMYPSMKGWDLFTESLTGAIPALAPGSMVIIGMVGYLFTITRNN